MQENNLTFSFAFDIVSEEGRFLTRSRNVVFFAYCFEKCLVGFWVHNELIYYIHIDFWLNDCAHIQAIFEK